MARTTPNVYRPKAHEVIELWGERHAYCEHPGAPGLVFAQEGGRGIVYQLTSAVGGKQHGLKVFAAAFRVPRHQRSSARLDQIGNRVGLTAARRRVVGPEDRVARQIPSLKYAVLMPWIRGTTWYDCLQRAEVSGASVHTADLARQFALSFLEIMAGLEADGIAHTDISPGNVILDQGEMRVELLDLEDVYAPGMAEPEEKTCGTPGYQHHKKRHTWRPEGDRYAVAVLTSEFLLLSDDAAARRSSTSGFFVSDCTDAETREVYEMAISKLTRPYPRFAKLFQVAWSAESLDLCPRIAELSEALRADVSSGNGMSSQSAIRVRPVMADTPAAAAQRRDQGQPFEWVADEDVPWVPIRSREEPALHLEPEQTSWGPDKRVLALTLLLFVMMVLAIALLVEPHP